MASALEIRVLDDAKYIKVFFHHPDIFATALEDTLDEFECNFDHEVYFGCFFNNRLIGIYTAEVAGALVVQLHIALLKEYRSQFLRKSAILVLSEVLECFPNCQKINAYVPAPYKHLYRFCKQLGFRDEGINRSSYLKNGKAVDMHYLGMTLVEIKAAIE